MKTSRKILLVLQVGLLILNLIGIEYSDLTWETNKQTYFYLILGVAIILALIFEPEDWWKSKSNG